MKKYTTKIIGLALASCIAGVIANASAEEGMGEPQVEVYGFVQMDGIYDFKTMDPSWNAVMRPSKIPVNCPGDAGCGENGETIFSVRQSRLGVNATFPSELGDVHTKFEFDMFGVGDDAGQTTIRLRHAYGEVGDFLAGQTNSLFMDGDVFPNTIEYWGPGGMVFYRNIQLRWTPVKSDDMKFAVALENPGSAIDAGNVVNPEGWNAWNKYPDLTAQVRSDQSWGHMQAAAIVRWLGFENPTLAGITKASGNVTGGGINLSGALNTVGNDKLLAQVAYGEGIAAYFNDCCVDVAPNGALNDGEAVPLLGWLLYYDHYWNEKWSSSVGYSAQDQDNTDGQATNAFKSGQYASANLLWYPVKNVMTGGELLWAERKNKDGASADDTRVQFSAKYTF